MGHLRAAQQHQPTHIHQQDYARAFGSAQRVSLKVPERHDKIPQGEELDVRQLVRDLEAAGITATGAETVEALVDEVAREARSGDVLLVMSNGSFGGFIGKVLGALSRRAGARR